MPGLAFAPQQLHLSVISPAGSTTTCLSGLGGLPNEYLTELAPPGIIADGGHLVSPSPRRRPERDAPTNRTNEPY
jgi:hypothetical protein